jgi:hypothetical protein
VTNATDCDDADADAFPGQTAFFPTPRASGGYDYNCDAVETKQYPGITGFTCQACSVQTGGICQTCLGGVALSPGYNCKASCGGATASAGFKVVPTPNCGATHTLSTCSASASCGVQETNTTATQGCR